MLYFCLTKKGTIWRKYTVHWQCLSPRFCGDLHFQYSTQQNKNHFSEFCYRNNILSADLWMRQAVVCADSDIPSFPRSSVFPARVSSVFSGLCLYFRNIKRWNVCCIPILFHGHWWRSFPPLRCLLFTVKFCGHNVRVSLIGRNGTRIFRAAVAIRAISNNSGE